MSNTSLQLAPPDRATQLLRLRRTMWTAFILAAVGVFGFALPLGFDPDTLNMDGRSGFAAVLSLVHFAGPIGCGALVYGSVRLWRLGALQFQLRTLLFATTVLGLLLSMALGNIRGLDSVLGWPGILTWLFVPVATSGYLAASIYVNWPCLAKTG
jgi:hypothetical protein